MVSTNNSNISPATPKGMCLQSEPSLCAFKSIYPIHTIKTLTCHLVWLNHLRFIYLFIYLFTSFVHLSLLYPWHWSTVMVCVLIDLPTNLFRHSAFIVRIVIAEVCRNFFSQSAKIFLSVLIYWQFDLYYFFLLLRAVLAMFLAIISPSSYSWNEWNVRRVCFHNQNNSTSFPGLLG